MISSKGRSQSSLPWCRKLPCLWRQLRACSVAWGGYLLHLSCIVQSSVAAECAGAPTKKLLSTPARDVELESPSACTGPPVRQACIRTEPSDSVLKWSVKRNAS